MNRNVVLVTIDSLRADHCGHWGYERDTTPTLDRMAAEGIVFENAMAPGPKTPESMPAIFTGEFPAVDFEGSDLGSWRDRIFPHMRARRTIAEAFSEAGYTTGAFTPNGFASEYFGFDAGFDHFDDFLEDEYRLGFDIPNVVRGLIKWVRREGNWKRWESYYDRVLEFVRGASEPYFLWVFLLDVHSPYLVPRQYRTENSWPEMMYANWKRSATTDDRGLRRRVVSAYDDTIRYADAFLERLLSDLQDSDPAVVVHSDHGEAFGEHGAVGHERLLFEENVHVPLVVGNVDASETVHRPVSVRRLPALLGALRENGPDELAGEVRARVAPDRPVLYRSQEGDRIGVRAGRFKLLSEGTGSSLYDLRSDPDEERDVSGTYPRVHDGMLEFVREHVACNDERRVIGEQTSTVVSGAEGGRSKRL